MKYDNIWLLMIKKIMNKKLKFNRRISRLLRRPKTIQLNRELKQFNKCYMITLAAVPVAPDNSTPYSAIEIFSLLVAWANQFFSLILKFFKSKSLIVYKLLNRFVLNHPWFGSYLMAISCALMIFTKIANEYNSTKTNLGYFLKMLFIAALSFFGIATFCMLYVFLHKYGLEIGHWFYDVFLALYVGIREVLLKAPAINYFNSPKLDESIKIDENLMPPITEIDINKGHRSLDSGKLFLFYSLLTVITFKLLLERFKRNLGGDDFIEGVMYDFIKVYGDNFNSFNSKSPKLVQ